MKAKAMRLICLVTTAILLVFSLAGCNKKTGTESSKTQSSVHQTLNVEVFDRGKTGQPDLNNNYWTKYVNDNFGKQFNVTVTYVPVPRTQEVDKLNVLMAAKKAPDICFTYNQGTVYNYVQQGGLAELDSLLQQYGQNLTKYLGEDVLKYGKFNGKMYSVPGKRTVLMGFNTFIRKDWLDALGLPLPTTPDEFYNDMVAFKTQNPGKVTGVIPYGYWLDSANPGIGYVPEAFKSSNLTEEQFATLQPYPIYQSNWNLPGYKDAIKFFNKMYNAGLVSPDFATDKDGKKLDADISNGKVGAFFSNWDAIYRTAPGDYINLKKNIPTAEIVSCDPWANDAGKHPKQSYSPNGMYIIIPQSSKVAALAIQYLNWMSDSKVTLFLQNGQEGVDYDMVNGVPKSKGTTTSGDKMMTVANNLDYDLLSNGIELGDPQKDVNAVSAGYPGFESLIPVVAQMSLVDAYQGYYYSIPNASDAKYNTALKNLSAQMLARLITCKPAEIDSQYKTLVDQYMAQGGKEVQDEYIKNYKTQNGK